MRAAAGELSDNNSIIDYFPSYEIITNPAARDTFFAPNLRSVLNEGVEVVMKSFFKEHPPKETQEPTELSVEEVPSEQDVRSKEDVQCDEQLLEAFGQ